MLLSQVRDKEESKSYQIRYDCADGETRRSRHCGKQYRTKEKEASES